jgi:6-phosphogluconolactonase/glucosamine-6-phosphate isomerase/deaminase
MTMTYPLLNRAHLIALLVTGASKRAALAQAATNPSNVVSCPVAGVVPAAGSKLLWFLDQNAVPQDRVVNGLD